MMSQVLISKIHCKFSANDKRDGEFNVYIYMDPTCHLHFLGTMYTHSPGVRVYTEKMQVIRGIFLLNHSFLAF